MDTLFDLAPVRPTTKQVAQLVKGRGAAGLPSAIRRGDAVTYQEVVCRSALNAVQGMPFRWTLNPYRGCTHGCHYCFARRYQSQLELDAGDGFSSIVFVKVNFPEVLARELARPGWANELVALGTATDPYQPIEGRYRLTRRSLEAIAARPTPVSIVTKGPMIVRDKDVLVDLSRRVRCTVCFSVPTVDDEAWARLEPGTAHPRQRLRAVKELREAGIDAGVLMAPVVPGLTTPLAKLERTVKAIAEHDPAFVGAMVLHLDGATRDHFMGFLAREFPHLTAGYDRLYATKYAPKRYSSQVHAAIEALKGKYGLAGRRTSEREPDDGEETPVEDRQYAFAWSNG